MKISIFSILVLFFYNFSFAQKDSLLTIGAIENCTVYLFQPATDTAGWNAGAGTIIKNQGRFILLTASHVAKSMHTTSKLVFHLENDKPLIVDLLAMTKNRLNWHIHAVADIAAIQLFPPSDEIYKRIDSIAFPSELIFAGSSLPPKEADITFLGYPVLDINYLDHFSALEFEAHLASGLMTNLRADTKMPCTFFYLDKPSIQGCSGGGVYVSVKKSFFYGFSKTYLIGIMHGTYSDNTGGKLAAVTPLSYLKDWNLSDE